MLQTSLYVAIHRTLPKNSQKAKVFDVYNGTQLSIYVYMPVSLTFGSKSAIICI
jgi:hypothetical protein